MPDKIIIADTSCFIVLSSIGELELLHHVYGKVYTTTEIAIEYGEPFPHWVTILSVANTQVQQLLEMQIDKGESSAIALALETPNCTVILDDFKARKIAERLGVSFTGTIGVIIRAKLDGKILSIKPLLNKIKQTNFRLSAEIETMALWQASE